MSVVREEGWGRWSLGAQSRYPTDPSSSTIQSPGESHDAKQAISSRITSERKTLSERKAATGHTGSGPSSQGPCYPTHSARPAPRQRRQHSAGPGHRGGIVTTSLGLGLPAGHTGDACRSGRNGPTRAVPGH